MNRRSPIETDETWLDLSPFEAALANHDMEMPPTEPADSLWAQIERTLAAKGLIDVPVIPDAGRSSVGGVTRERYDGGAWRKLAPGVRMKRLWGPRTLLIECAPGAMAPPHRHRTVEHALVLSGDVISDQGHFEAGDYYGMPAGSAQGAWTSHGGCRVLIQYDT